LGLLSLGLLSLGLLSPGLLLLGLLSPGLLSWILGIYRVSSYTILSLGIAEAINQKDNYNSSYKTIH
jgi:hypothetical protein